MLRLFCSHRAPYDTLEESVSQSTVGMDNSEPDGDPAPESGGGGSGSGPVSSLKVSRSARSPEPASHGSNTKESTLHVWRAALGLKAKSNTRHLDRTVRSQQQQQQQQTGGQPDSDRYIRLPERAASRLRHPDHEETHVHWSRLQSEPLKDLVHLPSPRRHRHAARQLEKSSSENALQRLGVRRTADPGREPPSTLQRLLRLEPKPASSAQSRSRRAKPRASSLERNHKFHVSPPGRAGSDALRARLAPDQHELSAPLVNLVMTSRDPAGAPAQGNFINKPARGWLHDNSQLADEGICYAVRYIGCLEVKESMKALNFDTRSLIAKECIARVCEAAGLIASGDRRSRLDKRLGRSLGERPIMDQAGSNVTLTITSSRLTLTTLEEGQVIASHEMPHISFASGGDPDTMDFVAYVAKDSRYGRVCFVLECGGMAQNVITTIGQAFELRFKEYLKRTPAYLKSNMEPVASASRGLTEDPEYYNDLPGKVPPDVPTAPVSAPRRAGGSAGGLPPLPALPTLPVDRDNNLIDLRTPPATSKDSRHEYVNDAVIAETRQAAAAAGARTGPLDPTDPFDMQPFGVCLPAGGVPAGAGAGAAGSVPPRSAAEHKQKLATEVWYHGPISRRTAESLLVRDGDFLVRESHGAPGQFVLTGRQNSVNKHLLLVDPEGVVRTKDRTFDSVSHLIQYHRDYQIPIISAETALTLRNPVPRR